MSKEIYFDNDETERLEKLYDRSVDINEFTEKLYLAILQLEYDLEEKTEKQYKGKFNQISDCLTEIRKHFSDVGRQLVLMRKYGRIEKGFSKDNRMIGSGYRFNPELAIEQLFSDTKNLFRTQIKLTCENNQTAKDFYINIDTEDGTNYQINKGKTSKIERGLRTWSPELKSMVKNKLIEEIEKILG